MIQMKVLTSRWMKQMRNKRIGMGMRQLMGCLILMGGIYGRDRI